MTILQERRQVFGEMISFMRDNHQVADGRREVRDGTGRRDSRRLVKWHA